MTLSASKFPIGGSGKCRTIPVCRRVAAAAVPSPTNERPIIVRRRRMPSDVESRISRLTPDGPSPGMNFAILSRLMAFHPFRLSSGFSSFRVVHVAQSPAEQEMNPWKNETKHKATQHLTAKYPDRRDPGCDRLAGNGLPDGDRPQHPK